MSTKKLMSVCLALALVLSAAPVLAANQTMMNEWNQPVDQSGAKGAAYSGQAELRGAQGPGGGGNFEGNFENDEGWTNPNAQGPGGGSADDNFDKTSDWK